VKGKPRDTARHSPAAGRPAQRADAELNRSRILDAARASLAESGDASMQSIARRAGIGQGTLYRHFPTREALVLEVHRHDVAELVDTAPCCSQNTRHGRRCAFG
jgi:AcrR family transcriptional regulator